MKLIAIDMDGTLLNSNNAISPENKKAIHDAMTQGHKVMICTGRTQKFIENFLIEEELPLPFAACNGAYIYADNTLINSYPIPHTSIVEAHHHLEKLEFPFKIYTNKGVGSNEAFLDRAIQEFQDSGDTKITSEAIIEYNNKNSSFTYKKIDELVSDSSIEIYKFFIFTPNQRKKKELLTILGQIEGITLTSSFSNNIEINSIDGHKGNGILQMAAYFGIPQEDTVAIGDNFNDLAMLQVAGLSVAMENGDEEIKKLCDVVTKSNNEHGVGYAIRKYVLNEDI